MKIPSIARYLYTIIQWYTFRSDTCWCAAFVGGVSFGLLIVNIRNDVSKLDQCWSPSIMFFTLLYAFLHLPDFWVPWRFNKWCVCWDYYVCCCDITTSGILSLRNIEVFGTLGLRILNISKDHGGGFRVALVSGRNSQRPTALEAWFLGVNSMQRRSKSGRLWVVSFPKVWRWGLKPGLFPWKILWFYVGQQSTLTSIFIEFRSYCTQTCLLDSNSPLVISLG